MASELIYQKSNLLISVPLTKKSIRQCIHTRERRM